MKIFEQSNSLPYGIQYIQTHWNGYGVSIFLRVHSGNNCLFHPYVYLWKYTIVFTFYLRNNINSVKIYYYRTPTGVIDHETCTDNFLYRPKLANKWNESGFRPLLCTYRLNWARRTSWGWWDDWDDTVLQTQDSKFKPWRSEAEHATSRSRRLPTILTFTRGWGRNILFLWNRRDREPNPELWRERQRC